MELAHIAVCSKKRLVLDLIHVLYHFLDKKKLNLKDCKQEASRRRLKKKKSGIFGKLTRSIFSPASIAKARGAVKVQEAKLEDLAGNIRSEITKAIEIQKTKTNAYDCC